MLTWIDWFNHRPLLEPIGNIMPADVEARRQALLNEQKRAASLSQDGLRPSQGSSTLHHAAHCGEKFVRLLLLLSA